MSQLHAAIIAFTLTIPFSQLWGEAVSKHGTANPQKQALGDSDVTRQLLPPTKQPSSGAIRQAGKGDLPLFRCESALSSKGLKDAKMECFSGEKTGTPVHLDLNDLTEIERKAKGLAMPACNASSNNRDPGSDELKENLLKTATVAFQERFYNLALNACKDKIKKSTGLEATNFTMIKPELTFTSSVRKPESFKIECRPVSTEYENIQVITDY